MRECVRKCGWAMGLAALLASSVAYADGNIDLNQNFAWDANVGWINFASSNSEVTVKPSGLSGYAWSENLGWIKLAAEGSSYDNTTTNNWGVKVVGNNLQGFAWSKNAGWINFSPTNGGVAIQSDGWFTGYAWGENVGWIHFNNTTYGVRTTASLGSGTLLMIQ